MELQRALTTSNIQASFCACDIWHLNSRVVDWYLGFVQSLTETVVVPLHISRLETNTSSDDEEKEGNSMELQRRQKWDAVELSQWQWSRGLCTNIQQPIAIPTLAWKLARLDRRGKWWQQRG